MRTSRFTTAAACAVLTASLVTLAGLSQPPGQARRTTRDDLAPATFAGLHALIRPGESEWRHLQVQWLTDVVAARKKAAAEDKPIIICYTGGAGYNEPLGTC